MNTDVLEELLKQVRKEFPTFTFSDVSSLVSGENHTALILDDTWVFRFPKSDAYRLAFSRQVNFLGKFAPLSPLPIPTYEYVAGDKSFGGYKMIHGSGLTPERFRPLSKETKKDVIETIARFLNVLHSLPLSYLEPPKPEEGYWDPDHVWKYTERYRTTRRGLIKRHISQKTLEHIDAFFPEFEELIAPEKKITHNDLRDAHILFKDGALRGVIDFSDAYVADPAYDFAYFWSWGRDKFFELLDAYKRADAKLPERSFWHYLRFEIDQLFYALRDKDTEKSARIIKILEEHLPNLLGSSR